MCGDDMKAFAVAHRIVHTLPQVDAMKLAKLLYYVQGWSQAWTGRPIFMQEPEAWIYGPVYPMIYTDWNTGRARINTADETLLSDAERTMIDAIVSAHASQSGLELMERTHEETPWKRAREGLPAHARSTRPITLASMMEYFSTAQGPSRPATAHNSDEGYTPPSHEFMRAQITRWSGLLARLGP